MLLSVIIVSYEVKCFLEQCLLSVMKASRRLSSNSNEVEIIVVDNASTDGTIDYLKDRFPSVRFIGNKTNLGFGKANNLALESANGIFILFLNPDTLVPEMIFSNCISVLQSRESVA